MHKYYLCILIGALDEPKGTLEGYLFKDEKKNRVYVRRQPCPGAKTIRTRYRTLGYRNGLTLAEVELLTGRTHQIRAHFASIGHPLLGDGKYGVNTQNKKFGGYKKQCSILTSFNSTFRRTLSTSPILMGKPLPCRTYGFAQHLRKEHCK